MTVTTLKPDIVIIDEKNKKVVIYELTVPLKKSRIRETKHLSTNADISTDTTVGWTKQYPKTLFFWKTEKTIQNAKNQKRLEICQN